MRYIKPHISAIIAAYNGELPLAHFLKDYFRQHPILGSRDRKIISALVYSWYRCAKAINGDNWLDLLTEQWLSDPGAFRNFSLEQWLADNEKEAQADTERLFPFDVPLSEGISKANWLDSMLVQPDLFIRIRREKAEIEAKLNKEGIPFTFISKNCVALPNGTKIEKALPPDSYVVQDASSQKTGDLFDPRPGQLWYDCCAGAGGKSLLLKDLQPAVKLTVSDKRDTVLHNLMKRFHQYHHSLPVRCFVDVANSAKLASALGTTRFDRIICDAPCSGSGTWARTPEQLYFFKPESVEQYYSLQKTIAANVSAHLKPGGKLFYITCSVFKEENEKVVKYIAGKTGLLVETSQLINGVSIRADSMYIAVLNKVK